MLIEGNYYTVTRRLLEYWKSGRLFTYELEVGDVVQLEAIEIDGSMFFRLDNSPYSRLCLSRDEARMGMLDAYRPKDFWEDVTDDEPPFPLDATNVL